MRISGTSPDFWMLFEWYTNPKLRHIVSVACKVWQGRLQAMGCVGYLPGKRRPDRLFGRIEGPSCVRVDDTMGYDLVEGFQSR